MDADLLVEYYSARTTHYGVVTNETGRRYDERQARDHEERESKTRKRQGKKQEAKFQERSPAPQEVDEK